MKSSFVKFAFAALFFVSASFADDFEDALAAVDSAEAANMPGMYDINHFEYLDCWVESAANIVPRERNRISAIRDEAKVCGCYTVREKGGFGWRANDEGKKVQAVINDYTAADNECVISVYPQHIIDNTGHEFTYEEMVCWVAGCTAGANVNESLTYAAHPDAVELSPVLTQTQQIQALNDGQFALFEEFGSIKNIQDINTFKSFAVTKGKQFRKNRVIRTLFGICNEPRSSKIYD